MILEALLTVAVALIHWVFALLPNVPDFNITLLEDLTGFVNLIFNNLQLLGFFIDINMLKTMIPLIIIVINLEHVYDLCMWVISKIPILNIRR